MAKRNSTRRLQEAQRDAQDHAGFRALVRALALDYADQVALDYASFLASF